MAFTLRPWPTINPRQHHTLPQFVQIVSLERGGFRNVDEDTLRREAKMEDSDEADEGKSTALTLYGARMDALKRFE